MTSVTGVICSKVRRWMLARRGVFANAKAVVADDHDWTLAALPNLFCRKTVKKMNVGHDVVKMSEALPVALLDLRAKVVTAKSRHPENLGALYPRYCRLMRQIREEKDLSIEELSALSGLSENFLEAAESGTVELTDDNLKALQGVYWELSIGEDNPGDFKRLATERLSTPTPEIGSKMREIREEKQISIKELSNLSGVPEDILEAAESGKLAMIGDDLEDVQRIYWSLSALQATPDDYRRLLAAMAT
jgi:transcriptional regulator with XRE-family HTH domain